MTDAEYRKKHREKAKAEGLFYFIVETDGKHIKSEGFRIRKIGLMTKEEADKLQAAQVLISGGRGDLIPSCSEAYEMIKADKTESEKS